MNLVRVILAEDHTIVREGLRSLLEASGDIQIACEVADGRSAVEACGRFAPDVAVLDLGMPELNGVDATREIRARFPAVNVLILSMHDSPAYVRPAIRAGAIGYLLKGSGISDLVSAIKAVAQGAAFFSPAVAHILLDESQGASGQNPRLTQRERQVLTLVAEGRSSPEIAQDLNVSVKTIEGHRGRIMSKLEVRNVAGLVRQAIKMGLVSAT